MAHKRGRVNKFSDAEGGNAPGDSDVQASIENALLDLDTSESGQKRQEARSLSREAYATADELEKQIDQYQRVIEENRISGLKEQQEVLDRLLKEIQSVGAHAEDESGNIEIQHFQTRIDEWKQKMSNVRERFSQLKEEIDSVLNEKSLLDESIKKEKKKPENEISRQDLQTIYDYYTQELLSDRPEAGDDAEKGVLSRILSGEKLFSEEREQLAINNVLTKLRQHLSFAELFKDKSSAHKMKWGPRYEKLKKLEHLFALEGEALKIESSPEIKEEVVKKEDKEIINKKEKRKKKAEQKEINKPLISQANAIEESAVNEPSKTPENDKKQYIKIKRSSGEMEDGWEIVERTPDGLDIIVRKIVDPVRDHFLVKTVTVKEFEEWNPEKESEKPVAAVSDDNKGESGNGESGEESGNGEAGGESEGSKKEKIINEPDNVEESYETQMEAYVQRVETIIAGYQKKIESVKEKYPRFFEEFSKDLKKIKAKFAQEKKIVAEKIISPAVIKAEKKKMVNQKTPGHFIQESLDIFEYRLYEMNVAYEWLMADPKATPWRNDTEANRTGTTAEKEGGQVLEPEEEVKKSWWQRTKEKIGIVANKETGKIAVDVAYKTVTSVFGIKTATDMVGALTGAFKKEFGFGDIHKMRLSAREMKAEKGSIGEVMKEVFDTNGQIEEKIGALKEKIDNSTHIDAKDKAAILKNLQRIATEYSSSAKDAEKDRDKKVESLLKVYMKNKVSGMTLAKDLLNTALTATGMSMVRGAVYAAMSVGERMLKSEREFEKKKSGRTSEEETSPESKAGYVLKDLTVNAAVETARSLVFMGAKKETKGTGRVIDFMRAVGTVARGFGIYGLALTDSMSPADTLQAFISKIEQQGITCAIKDDFITNAERTIQFYSHPIDTISSRFGGEATHAPVMEEHIVSAESGGHGISPEMAILQKFHLESAEMDPDQLNQAVTKFGQLEGAGVSLMALQQLAEGGITPEEISAMDNVLALANGRPEAITEFSQAIMNGHSPQEIFESTQIHKGDGLERVLQRQLKINPEAFGYEGDLNDQQSIQRWAGHEASVIAQQQGLADKYFVFHEDRPQFLVLHKDGSVDVGGRLYREIPKPPAELAEESVAETGDKVDPVQELIDAKTGQPIFMTDAEQAEYERLVRNEDYDDAMAYRMQARERGPVYELSDGSKIHRVDVTEWVGGKPEIVVYDGVRIGFDQENTGLWANKLNVSPATQRLYEEYDVNLSHNGIVKKDFIPDYIDEDSGTIKVNVGFNWGTKIDDWVMKNELVRVSVFNEALKQTSDIDERQAILNSLHASIRDASQSAGAHPDEMFEKKFLDEVGYDKPIAVAETTTAVSSATEASGQDEPKTYEEIVRRAQSQIAKEEVTAGASKIAPQQEDVLSETEHKSIGFNRFFEKGGNFYERMTALRETLEPGVRTSYNNVEYLYDGEKIHYKIEGVVGILDTPQEANALADVDHLYKSNSYMMGSNDETTAEYKIAMDVLRGGSQSGRQ